MNRITAIALLFLASLSLMAQDYPSDWVLFTSDGYFHDIESGQVNQKATEANLKNYLLDLARANLSKQIEVRVEEVSSIDKNVVNGMSDIRYTSRSHFTTNLDIRLSETRSFTDNQSGIVYVIAYINKKEVCIYYRNELQKLLSKVDQALVVANNYTNTGFKAKAKEELQGALSFFVQADELFFWFNVFGMDKNQINQYLNELHQRELTVKTELSELEHGTVYCVVCTADNFGTVYNDLENELKGQLSQTGCSFTDILEKADFVIHVEASAREYNVINSNKNTFYFAFVDAAISVDKNATGQRILEDVISVKGSHTLGYKEAAHNAYQVVSKNIIQLLKECIKY